MCHHNGEQKKQTNKQTEQTNKPSPSPRGYQPIKCYQNLSITCWDPAKIQNSEVSSNFRLPWTKNNLLWALIFVHGGRKIVSVHHTYPSNGKYPTESINILPPWTENNTDPCSVLGLLALFSTVHRNCKKNFMTPLVDYMKHLNSLLHCPSQTYWSTLKTGPTQPGHVGIALDISVVRYLKLHNDNDTVSGIAILNTTAIPEMRSANSMSFRICQSQYSVYSQTVAVIARTVTKQRIR